jgi:hypothetical protein
MGNLNFDPRQHKPTREGMDLWGEGWYLGYISKSNTEQNNAKTGGMLQLTIQVQQGGGREGEEYANNLNLWNPSPQAVEIAFGDLSAICWVTGHGATPIDDVSNVKDMAVPQLHNVPFYFRVIVTPRKDKNTKQVIPDQFNNNVRGYRDQWGRTPDQIMANAPQQQPPELATAGGTPAASAPSLPPAPPHAAGMPGASVPPGMPTGAAPTPQPPQTMAPPAPVPVAPAPAPQVAPPMPGAAPAPVHAPTPQHFTPAAPVAPAPAAAPHPQAAPPAQGWQPGQPPGAPSFVPPGAA